MSIEEFFKGKRVLVTGASRGIGAAVVKRLHSYNSIIYALAKSEENLRKLKQQFPSIQTIQCDLTNWEETVSCVSQLERIDCLLSNAGSGVVKTLMTSSPQDFDNIFNLNVKGAWNVSRIVGEKMKDSGSGGSITFISSIGGGRPNPHCALYCMSKGALEVLSHTLAVELGPWKVRVNSIRPGAVDTELLSILEKGVDDVGGGEGLFKSFLTSRTPFPGYHMDMDGLVNLILFSLSDFTNQMTGTVLTMDGGYART